MNKFFGKTALCALFLRACVNVSAAVTISSTDNSVNIENEYTAVKVSLEDGSYDIYDTTTKSKVIEGAKFLLEPRRGTGAKMLYPKTDFSWLQEEATSYPGRGKRIVLRADSSVDVVPTTLLTFTVFEDKPYILIGWGIENDQRYKVRVSNAHIMHGARITGFGQMENPQTLVSGAGKTANFWDKWNVSCNNGAFLTAGVPHGRRTIGIGGATYKEFIRQVNFGEYADSSLDGKGKDVKKEKDRFPQINLVIHDPAGKFIPAGEIYRSADDFYVNVVTADPFDACEMYGEVLRDANNASPNVYDFPAQCGWTSSKPGYGEGRNMNNSAELVRQLDFAREKGLHKYFKPGVRLEPDTYSPYAFGRTEQGWWTNERCYEQKHLVDPYPTFEAFGEAVRERGGEWLTYFQCSLPSRDFIAQHPEWMVGNDAGYAYVFPRYFLSEVQYDFTNLEFQKYLIGVYRRLSEAGLSGIKFDYPGSSWVTKGGFDDPSATTSSAYRKQFELAREGMGPEGLIHERALGNQGMPITDITAGVADLQRVWGDSSKLEPQMVTMIGMRWYKNRQVYRYYPDTKGFNVNAKQAKDKIIPHSKAHRQTILSICAFVESKLDLATSYERMTAETAHDLTRIFPMLPNGVSPRPVDMLINKHPNVYSYNVNDHHSQVMVYNPAHKPDTKKILVPFSGDMASTGSLGLDGKDSYYVFDFWDQKLLGLFSGSESFSVTMPKATAKVYSVRKKLERPQIISTDRHVMQGLFEVSDVSWSDDSKQLSFELDLVEGDPTTVSIALNGYKYTSVNGSDVETEVVTTSDSSYFNLKVCSTKSGKRRIIVNF